MAIQIIGGSSGAILDNTTGTAGNLALNAVLRPGDYGIGGYYSASFGASSSSFGLIWTEKEFSCAITRLSISINSTAGTAIQFSVTPYRAINCSLNSPSFNLNPTAMAGSSLFAITDYVQSCRKLSQMPPHRMWDIEGGVTINGSADASSLLTFAWSGPTAAPVNPTARVIHALLDTTSGDCPIVLSGGEGLKMSNNGGVNFSMYIEWVEFSQLQRGTSVSY